MKNKFIFILIISLATVAYADDAKDADETTKIINAQVKVTHAQVENLLGQIQSGNLPPGDPYPDANYTKMANDFKVNVNNALAEYDQRMATVILPKAKYWIDRYAATVRTASDDADFVKAAAAEAQRQLDIVSQEHGRMIANLYLVALGDVPVAMQGHSAASQKTCHYHDKDKNYSQASLTIFYLSGKTEEASAPGECLYREGRDGGDGWYYICDNNGCNTHDTYELQTYDDIKWRQLLKYYVAPVMLSTFAKDCDTSTCRQLRIADVLQYLNLVSKLIDKPIELSHGLKIPAPKIDIGWAESTLMRVQP